MSRALTLGVALLVLGAGSCHRDFVFDELSSCGIDSDCVLTNLHCNGGRCVACTSDAHCTAPGYPRCDMALHRCVECGVSADCGGANVCHTGHCVAPCTGGCPASAPICDDGACSQCDDGRGCAGSTAGAICIDHVCGDCRDDTACGGTTPRCDPVSHECVQCQANVDCPAARPLCDVAVGMCVALPR